MLRKYMHSKNYGRMRVFLFLSVIWLSVICANGNVIHNKANKIQDSNIFVEEKPSHVANTAHGNYFILYARSTHQYYSLLISPYQA